MSTVVVAGALANKAGSGGEAWVRLSWVRGLQALGLDVFFVEELDPGPGGGGHPAAVAYFEGVVARFGLRERATLLVGDEACCGPGLDDLVGMAPSATLVNISGHLHHARLFPAFRRRVLVDIDPGFTQVWHAAGDPGARVEGHEVHFTIGEHIGAPGCPVPTGGVQWRHVRQPVILDDWPVTACTAPCRFTTVASWRGPFGPVELDGRTYGLKAHEFRKVIELPRRSPHTFELALAIHPDDEVDRRALVRHGWHLVDPGPAAAQPETFRSYVQGSGAEFSVAQGVYVGTGSGWFSDRTVRYLASGRPALVQDTGFSSVLPTGDGLVRFRTLEEAVTGAERITRDHAAHAEAARAIAKEHFAAERILPRFCDEAGITGA
ncbi:MAG: hypothetical protein KY454_00145 [Actinobacteria bacterium]|nr:hypothetical protein [Actinomycetota bacterium]MBW3648953.1 hypothetical protein [Actinomycetota bacterium]